MCHLNHRNNDVHKQKTRGSWVEKGVDGEQPHIHCILDYPRVILSFLFSGLPPKIFLMRFSLNFKSMCQPKERAGNKKMNIMGL